MDSVRVLNEAFKDYESERAMLYDKLSRTLSNLDLESNPKLLVKGIVENIANLESYQKTILRFIEELQLEVKSNLRDSLKSDESPDKKS